VGLSNFGKLNDVDTSAFSVNDSLFVSLTSGELTNSPPDAPHTIVHVGYVLVSDAINGVIQISNINKTPSMARISDVDGSTPVNGSVLAYNSSTTVWERDGGNVNTWDSAYTTVNSNSGDWESAGASTSYYTASANTLTTFNGLADTLIPAMTVTPAAGTYYVIVSIPVTLTNKLDTGYVTIYAGGAEAQASRKSVNVPGNNDSTSVTTIAIVTVNGAQAIEARWSIDDGGGGGSSGSITSTPKTIVVMGVTPGA